MNRSWLPMNHSSSPMKYCGSAANCSLRLTNPSAAAMNDSAPSSKYWTSQPDHSRSFTNHSSISLNDSPSGRKYPSSPPNDSGQAVNDSAGHRKACIATLNGCAALIRPCNDDCPDCAVSRGPAIPAFPAVIAASRPCFAAATP
jgi:hypothetical protein